MKIETTKQTLLESARKLFAQLGLKDTTMNDIAAESHKGRRTVYTYFKSKNEILDAIIEEELQFIIHSMKQVMKMDMEPLDKFKKFVVTRMDAVKTAVKRNGSLHAEFFRDVFRVELVRRKLEKIELDFLKNILQEGIDKNIFNIDNINQTSVFIHYMLRGLDVPYIRGLIDICDMSQEDMLNRRVNIMIQGLLK